MYFAFTFWFSLVYKWFYYIILSYTYVETSYSARYNFCLCERVKKVCDNSLYICNKKNKLLLSFVWQWSPRSRVFNYNNSVHNWQHAADHSTWMSFTIYSYLMKWCKEHNISKTQFLLPNIPVKCTLYTSAIFCPFKERKH